MAKHKDYYKEEGGGFLQVQAVVSLVSSCLFVPQKCSKYALINLLFGLCRSKWIIDSLVTRPSPHFGAPTHPFTLKVLRVKERTPTPYPFVIFTFGLALESIKEFGVRHLSKGYLLGRI